MNKSQKTTFETRAMAQLGSLRNTLKSGEARGSDAKQANYREIVDLLQQLHFNTQESDVTEGADILAKVLGRKLEIEKPPADNGAAARLVTLLADSSGVSRDIGGVIVQLDCDQLKHQHPTVPIGSRHKGGGNRFVVTCNAAWHEGHTMAHMAQWATGLGAMTPGQTTFHGQTIPVDGIHYEGFCLFASGRKYVSFHCYPSDASDLKL
jgi:hypothetical protein